jgi:hypothetical protein
VAARVSRLAKRAGVKLTMRVLRRGFGSHYAEKVSAQVLQRLMRHASITTTMTFYANVDTAVEEAILGKRGATPQRNSLCNTPSVEGPEVGCRPDPEGHASDALSRGEAGTQETS